VRLRRGTAMLAVSLGALALSPAANARADDSAPTVPFDAYIAGGDASCVEFSVGTGYSFVVEPDARLPRATADISEGSSSAIAAPADPGDSVDALAGLMIPREEETVSGYMQQYFPQGNSSELTTVENEVNPHLEYPIEHASASYPNPEVAGPQEQTYLGAPNAAYSDPTGIIGVDGTAGDAKADALSASAESGAGAAVSLPMLGLSIGRVLASATATVDDSAVSDDVSCSLQDVSVTPPGSSETLHIGSLIETLQTQRPLTGGSASEKHTLQLADVTVDGKDVLPAGQGPITIPSGVPTSQSFPAPPSPQCNPSLPDQQLLCTQTPALQSVSLAATAEQDALSANGNEISSTLTAATIVIKTTAPVPSSIPPVVCGGIPPNPTQCPSTPNPLSTTPAVYTLQLANLDSQTYGLPTQTVGGSSSAGLGGGGAAGGVAGLAGGYSGGGSTLLPGTAGLPAVPASAAGSSLITIPGTAGALRWSVVLLAALMEVLLLGSLFARRRWFQGRRATAASPARFLDLP
jgi:hypothetical protein